jgi:hypothetical protein
MDFNAQLRPYVDGPITIKEKVFTLESLEEDHLVLRDEDSMHTFIWFSSIQSVTEAPPTPPEIILFPRKSTELD